MLCLDARKDHRGRACLPAANGGAAIPTYVAIQDNKISAWRNGVRFGVSSREYWRWLYGGSSGHHRIADMHPWSPVCTAAATGDAETHLGGQLCSWDRRRGYTAAPAVTVSGAADQAATLRRPGRHVVASWRSLTRARVTTAPVVTSDLATVASAASDGHRAKWQGDRLHVANHGSGYIAAPRTPREPDCTPLGTTSVMQKGYGGADTHVCCAIKLATGARVHRRA